MIPRQHEFQKSNPLGKFYMSIFLSSASRPHALFPLRDSISKIVLEHWNTGVLEYWSTVEADSIALGLSQSSHEIPSSTRQFRNPYRVPDANVLRSGSNIKLLTIMDASTVVISKPIISVVVPLVVNCDLDTVDIASTRDVSSDGIHIIISRS